MQVEFPWIRMVLIQILSEKIEVKYATLKYLVNLNAEFYRNDNKSTLNCPICLSNTTSCVEYIPKETHLCEWCWALWLLPSSISKPLTKNKQKWGFLHWCRIPSKIFRKFSFIFSRASSWFCFSESSRRTWEFVHWIML